MTVKELIAELQLIPEEATLLKSEWDSQAEKTFFRSLDPIDIRDLEIKAVGESIWDCAAFDFAVKYLKLKLGQRIVVL